MSLTVSAYEQAWPHHGWEVRDGRNIAAYAFRLSYITGWVRALNGSRKM